MTRKENIQRQRLNPEERKEQLLSCAVTAYARSGVERAGHGDVAKLAGVSTATVFNYFPTRDILTDAVFDIIRSTVMGMFGTLPETANTASDQIKVMAQAYDALLVTQPDMIKVFLNWSVAFGPDVRPQFLSLQDEVLTEITRHLPGRHTDRSDARVIMAAGDMLAIMKLDNTDADTIQRFIDRVANALE